MTSQPSFANDRFDRRAIPAGVTESYWRAPDGHKIRRADWPAPDGSSRGSLLFLPGRADFYEKYLETLQSWHGEGWHVTAADWRGQAFSGRLGRDETTGHIEDFGLWVDDLAAFWRQWSGEDAGPHVIVAHSMGAHIVLRALAEGRIAPDAVVMIAPMLGLQPAFVPLPVQHLAARFMTAIGDPARCAWDGCERPGKLPQDRAGLLTHDAERYADELWWRSARPELSMGAPSWRWIERAMASMRYLRRPGILEAVARPVLIVATSRDGLVDYRATARAARRIPGAQIISYGSEARHEVLRECDAVRDDALAEIDRFLDRVAPVAG